MEGLTVSRLLRNRTVAYDNIAKGSATGQERTKGNLTSEVYGAGTNLGVGTSWHTTDPAENMVPGTLTPAGENVDTTSNIST